ncbi:MAG TPA: cytochrome c maturation protein CcmE [Firmicutes bacterium]|nr:cytochrome c maturation protein CcmE [Bacillota bacterium]
MARKKLRILLLSLLPLFVLGFLAFRAFENSAAYYYTISEVQGKDVSEQKLRVKGQLVEDSVVYDASIPLLEFRLTDGNSYMKASYRGVLPDNFHHSEEVIVEGTLHSQGEFTVSKLMLQCPSKYEGEE